MRGLRFGIRDLLWAMAVLGLALGWGVYWQRTRETAQQRERQLEYLQQYTNSLSVQIKGHGLEIVESSIGPFVMSTEQLERQLEQQRAAEQERTKE